MPEHRTSSGIPQRHFRVGSSLGLKPQLRTIFRFEPVARAEERDNPRHDRDRDCRVAGRQWAADRRFAELAFSSSENNSRRFRHFGQYRILRSSEPSFGTYDVVASGIFAAPPQQSFTDPGGAAASRMF
jgi:hypothetical protein